MRTEGAINYIEKYSFSLNTIEHILIQDNTPVSHKICETGVCFFLDQAQQIAVLAPKELIDLFNIDTSLPTHVLYYACGQKGILQLEEKSRPLVYKRIIEDAIRSDNRHLLFPKISKLTAYAQEAGIGLTIKK